MISAGQNKGKPGCLWSNGRAALNVQPFYNGFDRCRGNPPRPNKVVERVTNDSWQRGIYVYRSYRWSRIGRWRVDWDISSLLSLRQASSSTWQLKTTGSYRGYEGTCRFFCSGDELVRSGDLLDVVQASCCPIF